MDLLTGISGHLFRLKYKGGQKQHLYLLSDLHLGSSATYEKRILEDLNEAMELNARININGDLLDGILPKDFMRYMPSVVNDKLQGRDDLINATVDYVVNFLKPYVSNIDEIADGNHELAILKHHSVDILGMVIDKLNAECGTDIKHGYYLGFITYLFEHESGGCVKHYKIFRNHGTTKSAPVSLGTIEFNRQQAQLGGVDCIWLGHSHDITSHPVSIVEPDQCGLPTYYTLRCIRTGGYLLHSKGGYAPNKGLLPKPHGGAILSIEYRGKGYKDRKVRVTN